MTPEAKKTWGLLALVTAVGVFILVKSVRLSWNDGELTMKMTLQKGGIHHIDVPRKPKETRTLKLQEINFQEGRMLENSQYGKLGYSTDFFLDITTKMKVAETGNYRFAVRSDDGFRLTIDGKVECEHPGDRPLSTTSCNVRLEKGTHAYALSYFQGGGPMGLQASYGLQGEKQRYFIGEDSDLIRFEKQ